jgi:hypothetical protein
MDTIGTVPEDTTTRLLPEPQAPRKLHSWILKMYEYPTLKYEEETEVGGLNTYPLFKRVAILPASGSLL